MHYRIYSEKPHTHFIDIELTVYNIQAEYIFLKIPNWRPGRYELGNFAKNVQHFSAFTDKGEKLPFEKINKSTWKIYNIADQTIKIVYNYFANQLDGGACYCNEDQLYLNPVHCCMYLEEQMHNLHTLELGIPADWKIATGLQQEENKMYAKDFDELADSPVIASPSLQHKQYKSGEIPFHIWIEGDFNPDWNTLIKDFKAFTDLQLKVMNDFPAKDYHFLIQVLPITFYHGVEHLNSTVIAIGPGITLNEHKNYRELTGIASHELFHSWNVKTIRPSGMMPYNYEKENYSRSGYVYEGFTSYYGDIILKRCNIFSEKEFFHEMEKRIGKHLNNSGRFNLSVADSSFDTWLDGYSPGIPNRKVSIYDEGCLIALMLDLLILKSTRGKKRLDDVMLLLYNDFGKKKLGYRDSDVQAASETVAGISLKDFFETYIFRPASYFDKLDESLRYAGCYLQEILSENQTENLFGFRINEIGPSTLVSSVIPGSPADIATLSGSDKIVSAYGKAVENNLNDLILQNTREELPIEIISFFKKKHVILKRTASNFYQSYKIMTNENNNEEQKMILEKWLNE